MAFGKGKQQGVTGPDYLLAAAAGAVEDGRPFAEEFQNMVFQAFVPDSSPASRARSRSGR